MSYDIHLTSPVSGLVLHLENNHHMRGGTYAVGGTTELWLNVTYNYASHYYKHFPLEEDDTEVNEDGTRQSKGIRWLYGKTGAESIPVLKEVITQLGDDEDPDYWKPTEGNAKAALCKLLAMAQLRPDGIWQGD